MSNWNQPICGRCWRAKHPDREPARVLYLEEQIEQCAFCGDDTVDGIYIRANPDTVPFPTYEDANDG